MRILHIIPSLKGSSGGPVQAVIQLCQELKNQGVELAIVTTRIDDYKNLDILQIMFNPVRTYYFNRQLDSFLPTQFAFSQGLGKWLSEHIREFDLLHIHYLFTYPSSIAAHYARKYKIPYIIRPAGMLSHLCLEKSAFKKKFYTLFFEKRNLQSASAIHFTSEEEINLAKEIKLDNKYILVPNGLDLKKFKNLESFKGLFIKRYPQINGRKIILFLSRINPIKGLDLLISALKILSQKRNDFVFIIAGPDSKNYQRWVKRALINANSIERTIFTGFVDGWMKFALLADSNVFILPSHHENFGIAAVEAMAAGLPVVISNRVNIYKLIEDYQAGIVTELDTHEIASALDKLLSDEHLRFKMGANGRKLVEDNFDVKNTAKQIIGIYSNLISNTDLRKEVKRY